MTPTTTSRPLLVLALLATWIIWGSSFVAISWALESIPPLLLMASRFLVAGLLTTMLGVWLARRAGARRPGRAELRDAAIVGAGFVAVGMGATSWASTRLPTGTTALLVATAPLFIALLQVARTRGRSVDRVAFLGLAVGTAGVAVLVAPGSSSQPVDLAAVAVLVTANLVWAATTLFAQERSGDTGLVLGVGMQMLAGGLLLAIGAVGAGEASRVDLARVDALAAGGWTFLVLAASIGGFVAYAWLLDNASASTASTHAFINPLVAVALGAVLLGEQVGAQVLASSAAIAVAVVLLLVGEARVVARAAAAVVVGSATQLDAPPSPGQPAVAGAARQPTRRIARPVAIGRSSSGRGWSPAPTPAFAARRTARPWQATDGMDALSIDEALDGLG
jgi:drug/metabolite transporter (DMT)-like permease